MVGDSTPVYLFWPNALERMRDYMPGHAADRRLPRPARAAVLALDDAPDPAPRLAGLARGSSPSSGPRRCPTRCRPTSSRCATSTCRGSRAATTARSWSAASRSSRASSGCCSSSARCWRRSTRRWTGPPTTSGCRASRSTRRCATGTPARELVTGTPPTAEDLQSLAELYAADLAVFDRLSGLDTSALADDADPRRDAGPGRAGRARDQGRAGLTRRGRGRGSLGRAGRRTGASTDQIVPDYYGAGRPARGSGRVRVRDGRRSSASSRSRSTP